MTKTIDRIHLGTTAGLSAYLVALFLLPSFLFGIYTVYNGLIKL